MCEYASLLVHEYTNGAIPERIQRGDKGMKVRSKGPEHSLFKKQEKSGSAAAPTSTGSSAGPAETDGAAEAMKCRRPRCAKRL